MEDIVAITYRITCQGVGAYQDWDALLRFTIKYGRVTQVEYREYPGPGAWVGHAGSIEIQAEARSPEAERDMAKEIEAWIRKPSRGIAAIGKAAAEGFWIRVTPIAPGEPSRSALDILHLWLLPDRSVAIYIHPSKPSNIAELGILEKYTKKIREEDLAAAQF